jgi:ribonucleotide reductase class II
LPLLPPWAHPDARRPLQQVAERRQLALALQPLDAATYQRLSAEVVARRSTPDFFEALRRYDRGELQEAGPAGCDSDKCLLPLAKPKN